MRPHRDSRRCVGAMCAWFVAATLLTAMPAEAQFGAGQYGNLVWDPDKQCWIQISRQGQTRRLVDGAVIIIPGKDGARDIYIAESLPYVAMTDAAPPAGTMIIGGVPRQGPAPIDYKQDFIDAINNEQVPALGPNGEVLAPGARAFIAGLYEEGYSDPTAQGRDGYGDVGGAMSDEDKKFWDAGVASSIHIRGYGDFYLMNNGGYCHHPGYPNADLPTGGYVDTTSFTGIGKNTMYGYPTAPENYGPLKEITTHVDPTTDRITHVTFDFRNGHELTVDYDSGTGLYLDPYPPTPGGGGGPAGGMQVLQYNPNNKKQPWVEPARKDQPQKKKQEPAPKVAATTVDGFEVGIKLDPMSRIGLGGDWHSRFDRDPDFGGEPQIGVEPSISLAFVGPPPGAMLDLEASGSDLQSKADAATEFIAKFKQTVTLISSQEKIARIQSDMVNDGIDATRKKLEDVLVGQGEALAGAFFSNANKLQKYYDKLPDGAKKANLGKFLNSGFYREVLEEGGKGGGSAGLLVYQTFKDGKLSGDDALNWFFSDFVGGGYLPPQFGSLVGQARAFGDTMVAYGQFANNLNDAGELQESINNIHRATLLLNDWVGDNRQVVDQYYGAVDDFVGDVIAETNGMDGLSRVKVLNDAIGLIQSTSNGLDISADVARLEDERDNTVIYLPGGDWGTEPVLYERLWLVPNAGARVSELIQDKVNAAMREKYGPGWDPTPFSPPPPPPQGSFFGKWPPPKKDGKKVQPAGGSGKAPPPKPNESGDGNQPVSLPDGSTASVPPGGAGPIIMSDGTRIYNYDSGRVERVFLMPGGGTVTHYRGGGVEVVGPDGTITLKLPNGITKITLPNGTVVVIGPDGKKLVDTQGGRIVPTGSGGNVVQPGSPLDEDQMPIITDSIIFSAEGGDDVLNIDQARLGLGTGNAAIQSQTADSYYLDTFESFRTLAP